MGAEVDAIDVSPAMLALADILARERKVKIRTQFAGLLSFAYQPNSYDLIVSEFALHHLPDFWKAVALSRIFSALKPGANFYLRDIVFVGMPDGIERDVEGWADFSIKNHEFDRESVVTHMRDEYSTFSWVIERMLTESALRLSRPTTTRPSTAPICCENRRPANRADKNKFRQRLPNNRARQ